MNALQQSAIATFHRLHAAGCFVLPNPWDAGTAIYLQHLGFQALATTSAGYAFSCGKSDGAISRDEMLEHIRKVVAATPLPVNADFLAGFADAPEEVAANVSLCVATGVAGLSIEDSTGTDQPGLYDEKLAVARLRSARRAIDDSGSGVVLTGRCEAFLVGSPEPFRTSLARLVAYSEAGADCLYAPGVSDPAEIAATGQSSRTETAQRPGVCFQFGALLVGARRIGCSSHFYWFGPRVGSVGRVCPRRSGHRSQRALRHARRCPFILRVESTF